MTRPNTRIEHKFYSKIPLLTILSASLFEITFIPPTGLILLMDKMVLYYWLIKRPDRVPLVFLSVFYLLMDIKEGWPLGSSSLLMLTFSWAVLLQRHVLFKQAFMIKWLYIGFILFVYLILVYSMHRFFYEANLAASLYGISLALGIFLYPVLSYLMDRLMRFVPYMARVED